MIPKQIRLTNFLSYRDASLDFEGVHVACIAGPNGAGKSSLLEAMAWAIWGQSRVATDDDVIHQGAVEARVTFVFAQGDQVYRVIRTRHRVQGSSLEFQVQTQAGYRVLTQRRIRATQQLICHHLKLDYETFINSAYLRQGRADDFMLKRPSERKQILADLLKLDQYDRLADRAREHWRQAKTEVALRYSQIDDITTALTHHQTALAELTALPHQLQTLDQQREELQQQRQHLQHQIGEHHRRQQQMQLKQQQYDHLNQLQQQTDASLTDMKGQLDSMKQVLARAETIDAELNTYHGLVAEEAQLEQQFQQYQNLQVRQHQLTDQIAAQTHPLQLKLQQLRAQRQTLEAQVQDMLPLLQREQEIDAARQEFLVAKSRLHHLDALQLQAEPLLQRRRQVEAELNTEQTRLLTKLEELNATLAQMKQRVNAPRLATNAEEISQTLDYLERRRLYQEQVQEKGQERRRFMETLQANQRAYEAQLTQAEQKLQLLQQPQAVCPLCDRNLDHHHRTLVEDRCRIEQQDLRQEIIIIREQLAVTEREIQVLRQEYRALEAELELYAPVLQQRGHLEAQLSTQADLQGRITQLDQERHQLQRCLDQGRCRSDLQTELQQLDYSLAQLAYDDRDHALVRGQVDRLRWANIKHQEIQQARRRQRRLAHQITQVNQAIEQQETSLHTLHQGDLQQALQTITDELAQLAYDPNRHQQIRQGLRQAQTYWLQHQDLERARQEYPQRQAQLSTLLEQRHSQQQELMALAEALHQLEAQLQDDGDLPPRLNQVDTQLQTLQQQREELMAQMGALQQQQQQVDDLQTQLHQRQQHLAAALKQQRIYQELAQAFGQKGIQAMMIENLLPQLEAEANHVLGRLTAHQLHVQFVTQRASKRRQGKLIDTLDILIADANGTRPYETYSGGEAFRVNFAIRLALARLLAQRSGLALKLLIIDEGFGTQDQLGCERLIGAINAIADDFACILAVTHIPHFREAFQTRIDVSKGPQGSWLALSS